MRCCSFSKVTGRGQCHSQKQNSSLPNSYLVVFNPIHLSTISPHHLQSSWLYKVWLLSRYQHGSTSPADINSGRTATAGTLGQRQWLAKSKENLCFCHYFCVSCNTHAQPWRVSVIKFSPESCLYEGPQRLLQLKDNPALLVHKYFRLVTHFYWNTWGHPSPRLQRYLENSHLALPCFSLSPLHVCGVER